MRRQAAWLIFAGALMLGFVIGWWLWLAPEPTGRPAASGRPEPRATVGPNISPFPGDIAPEIELPLLDGETGTLGEHRGGTASASSGGHRVLLNFFASWCEACRAEMPAVQAQAGDARKHAVHDWVVLGVDVMETREAVSAFRDEFGLTFPILLDERGRVTRQYLITGTPTSLFVDRAGLIVERRLGYMSEAEIAEIIEVNFWASWCPPCREEAAYLERTWRKYEGKDVVFIGVDWVDTEKEALSLRCGAGSKARSCFGRG